MPGIILVLPLSWRSQIILLVPLVLHTRFLAHPCRFSVKNQCMDQEMCLYVDENT